MFGRIKKSKSLGLNSIDNEEPIEQEVEFTSKTAKSKYGPELLPSTARPFMEIYGIHIDQAKKWKAVTFVALAIAAFCAVWAAKVSTGIKYVPVMIEKNDIGALTPLGVLSGKQLQVNETIILAQIATYVNDLRSVIQDVKLEQNRGRQIDLMTGEADRAKMRSMFIKQLTDAGMDTINVTISSIMPVRASSNNTWRTSWSEVYGTNPGDVKRYEAIFNVNLVTLSTNDPDEIMLNATGIQISNFNVSQVFDSSTPVKSSDSN